MEIIDKIAIEISKIMGKDEEEIEEILSILNEIARHVATAEMNEFVISDSNKNIIGTVGLAVCDGIIFYDRKSM